MKRLLVIASIASVGTVLAAALASAAPAHNGPHGTSITIRHQMRGCHAWSYDGGAYRPALRIGLPLGSQLRITNNDVMSHKLVQLAGPTVSYIGRPLLNHMGAAVRVSFLKTGVYRFTTRAGEDYMPGMKTIGEDNVLTLEVVVK
jgi:hypothetical protein